MPEFILNTPPTRSHPFHDLSDFAKGYVEAMFFTNGDTGDERENLLNEWGVARLTHASVAAIARDCKSFYHANKPELEAAQALEPGGEGLEHGRDSLDERRLGQLFWYARQGHGVAFTDDGYAPCLEALQDAARAFGQTYIEAYRGWIYYR